MYSTSACLFVINEKKIQNYVVYSPAVSQVAFTTIGVQIMALDAF